ncbi:uncharacterized protein LOC114334421 [Diabrotica virgifera virgifera]|uniref:separase n=1 Tax=Diabrotica virgifera virgifera TaxID=50390 RepID=A0ABM5IS21_DIAVI|nr:uncharacterized protein LOC114334421 [Diabrotica virgifera virgifera]XP_028140261.2 uncharacterized protein LOC114334421 [Diabrotica virgifera virgifera]
MVDLEEISKVLKELENIHLAGPVYEKVSRLKAVINAENNELDAIYNLVESHSPGLRNKTVLRYEKLLKDTSTTSENASQLESTKVSLSIKCPTYPNEKKVEDMLKQIQEMPKEWTVIQLTPQYNAMELLNEDNNVHYTNAIHITFFNCNSQDNPFYVVADAPRDKINGTKIELCEELFTILRLHKEVLSGHNQKRFASHAAKNQYYKQMQSVEDRLKLLIKDMQNYWLKEWKCLFAGKYDEQIESQIKQDINQELTAKVPDLQLTSKIETILSCSVKNYLGLKINEVRDIVQYCFPEIKDTNLIRIIVSVVRTIGEKFYLRKGSTEKKHPVILIVHDSLDYFPWEQIDVLADQPVYRLPSLHFLYCLFKEHESDIVDGYKVVRNYDQGRYVVNPTNDLPAMETRMMAFFNYWLPTWTGIVGKKPSKEEFLAFLTSSEILSFNGHGSGNYLVSSEQLQKTFVKAVVLLFGCSSSRIYRADPQTEMFGDYYTYLIARCPCVIGMLWTVTDKSTDDLTSDFLSYWIPSSAPKHWKLVNNNKWHKEGELVFQDRPMKEDEPTWEPDLLRALILAKKNLSLLMTKAACVARGIPVKIIKE